LLDRPGGSNPEPIKSPTRCQRLATVATLIVWALAQSREDGHRSLVTLERVLSECNEDLIFWFFFFLLTYSICPEGKKRSGLFGAGFFPVTQSCLKCFQKAKIGWKNPTPEKGHFLFGHANRITVPRDW